MPPVLAVSNKGFGDVAFWPGQRWADVYNATPGGGTLGSDAHPSGIRVTFDHRPPALRNGDLLALIVTSHFIGTSTAQRVDHFRIGIPSGGSEVLYTGPPDGPTFTPDPADPQLRGDPGWWNAADGGRVMSKIRVNSNRQAAIFVYLRTYETGLFDDPIFVMPIKRSATAGPFQYTPITLTPTFSTYRVQLTAWSQPLVGLTDFNSSDALIGESQLPGFVNPVGTPSQAVSVTSTAEAGKSRTVMIGALPQFGDLSELSPARGYVDRHHTEPPVDVEFPGTVLGGGLRYADRITAADLETVPAGQWPKLASPTPGSVDGVMVHFALDGPPPVVDDTYAFRGVFRGRVLGPTSGRLW